METRGFWLDCLCAMYEADTCELSGNLNEIARLLGCFPDEITRCANELQRTQTADVTISDDYIHLKSRRLERELSVREGNRKRQAKIRENGGGDPERWTAIRAVILTRDNKICAYCGRRATTVDHIFPKSRGGSHDPSNLVACCKKCNERKNNRTPDEAGMSFIASFNVEVLQSHTEVTPKSPYIVKSKSNNKKEEESKPPTAARQEEDDLIPVDRRKNHPALVTVQSVTHRYPPKEIWDDIIDHVGAIDIDSVRMRKCFTTWVSRGFNKVNYDWLFDWYVNNRIPEAGNRTNGTNNKSYQDRRAELAREQFEIESNIRRRVGERDRGLSGAALLDNSRQLQSFRPDTD